MKKLLLTLYFLFAFGILGVLVYLVGFAWVTPSGNPTLDEDYLDFQNSIELLKILVQWFTAGAMGVLGMMQYMKKNK